MLLLTWCNHTIRYTDYCASEYQTIVYSTSPVSANETMTRTCNEKPSTAVQPVGNASMLFSGLLCESKWVVVQDEHVWSGVDTRWKGVVRSARSHWALVLARRATLCIKNKLK